MPRASETQKAERLNRARELLRHVDQLSDAVEQLAHACSISPRQAYRYLEQAQHSLPVLRLRGGSMPQSRQIPGQSQNLGLLLGRGEVGFLTLKFHGFLLEIL